MNATSTLIASILFEKQSPSLQINGNSMYPTIKSGQRLKIRPFSTLNPQLGKCYIFLFNGKLIIHRLLWYCNCWAYFAGDANRSIEKIEIGSIIGEPCAQKNRITHQLVVIVNMFFFLFKKSRLLFSLRPLVLEGIFKIGAYDEKKVSKT